MSIILVRNVQIITLGGQNSTSLIFFKFGWVVDNTFFLGLTTENNYLFFLYTDFIDSVVACKKGITRRWFKVECVTQDECLKIVTYKKWNC